MYKVLTAKQMREVDAYMINEMRIPSLLLMENAAMGVCRVIMAETEPCTVRVFCGTGNNGGDGLAVARILMFNGYDVYVAVAGDAEKMTADAAANFAMFEKLSERTLCFKDIAQLESWDVPAARVVVDALFGTGLSREVSGLYRDTIEHINESGALVVSVDIPSGVDADNGAVLGDAVAADITVTFQHPKAGHFLFPGRYCRGRLEVVRIGVDEGCDILASGQTFAYTSADAAIALERREIDANKGSYGRLLVVAGSQGMAGAAVLTCRAASRAGAGLVTLASTEEATSVVQNNVPEATCKILSGEEGRLGRRSVFDIARIIKGKTALAIGPGLNVGEGVTEAVEHIIKDYPLIKVLDADAINAIAGRPSILLERAGEIILTPHPKEFARLIGSNVAHVLSDSLELARSFATKYGVTLVLKGATTVVAAADGRAALVAAGSPGMAKGGSGDVLTGIIGGFAAQGMGAYESALKGVYIAAMAGEAAAEACGEYATGPMDTIDHIGYAIGKTLQNAAVRHYETQEEPPSVPPVKESAAQPVQPVSAEKPENTITGAPPILGNGSQDGDSENENLEETLVGAPPLISEKTAEQALAEIEMHERTQEISREKINEASKAAKADEPTRRRIG